MTKVLNFKLYLVLIFLEFEKPHSHTWLVAAVLNSIALE